MTKRLPQVVLRAGQHIAEAEFIPTAARRNRVIFMPLQHGRPLQRRWRQQLDAVHATGKQGGIMPRQGGGCGKAIGRRDKAAANRFAAEKGFGPLRSLRKGCAIHSGAALFNSGRQAEHHLVFQAKRRDDLLAHDLLKMLSSDTASSFTEQPGVSQALVAAFSSGRHGWRHRRQPSAHLIPIRHFRYVFSRRGNVHAGSMAEHLPDADVIPALAAELWPDLGHARVIRNQPVFHQAVKRRGHHAFAHGENRKQRIRRNGLGAGLVNKASAQLSDLSAMPEHGQLAAAFLAGSDRVVQDALQNRRQIRLFFKGIHTGQRLIWGLGLVFHAISMAPRGKCCWLPYTSVSPGPPEPHRRGSTTLIVRIRRNGLI